MAAKKKSKKKITGKKQRPVKVDPETLRSANAKLKTEAAYSGTGIDSIERRLPDGYDSVPGYKPENSLVRDAVRDAHLLRQLATSDKLHHYLIARCQMAYISKGVIKNVVDLLADFASEGLDIVHEQQSDHNFYQLWMKKVKLRERINRFITDQISSGQVFIYKIRAKINSAEERNMKRGKAEDVDKINENTFVIRGGGKLKDEFLNPDIVLDSELMQLADLKKEAIKQAKDGRVTTLTTGQPSKKTDKVEGKKNDRMIPWEYISLSPLQMETRGRKLDSDGNWVFVLSKQDTMAMTKFLDFVYNQKLRTTEVSIPENLSNKISKYGGENTSAYTTEIKMTPDDMTVIHDKKFDTWAWAVPYTFPSLEHLDFKDCLRDMEKKYCRSVINSVTLWTLGDPANGLFPEDEHFERLAEMLQQPGQAMNIIWPAPIKGEVIETKLTNALDPKKYEAVDKDILNALGIPDVLIGGKGSNFSNSSIAVIATLKKLEIIRNKFESWLLGELKEIAEAMGFRNLPTIRWKRSSLRDQKAQQNFKMQLYDRGILSAEALLIEADEDIGVEVKRQVKEKKIADGAGVGVMDKRGPYFRPEELAKLGIFPYGWDKDRNMEAIKREDMEFEIEKQGKMNSLKEQQTETGPNGRPPGKDDDKDRKTREPEQKSVDAETYMRFNSLKEKGIQLLSDIEENVRERRDNKSGGVSEKMVFSIASNIGPKYTQKMISDRVIKYNKKAYVVDADIATTFKATHNTFKIQAMDSKTTKADRFNIFACSWAAHNMS